MTRVILLAGPSGSGKSYLAHHVGAFAFRLDDFYRDLDHPGMPEAHGAIDWDDARTWDAEAAVTALKELLETGRTTVPTYSISLSRATGTRVIELRGEPCVIAEGIFAVDLLAPACASGLPVEPWYLDRNRTLVALLRLQRDLRAHRKPPLVLLRRGLRLWKAQPSLRREAAAAGFVRMAMRDAQESLAACAAGTG